MFRHAQTQLHRPRLRALASPLSLRNYLDEGVSLKHAQNGTETYLVVSKTRNIPSELPAARSVPL